MVWLMACAVEEPRIGPIETETETGTHTAPAECVAGMAQVGTSCIDAVEVSVTGELGNLDQGVTWPDGSTTAVAEARSGQLPSTNVSWYQAYAACANVGKHLCTWEEWRDACDRAPGDGGHPYPWGEAGGTPEERCALANPDGSTNWDGLLPAASLAGCTDAEADVYDLIGNAWEWADPQVTGDDGRPLTAKVGGAWYAGYSNGTCGEDAVVEGHPPEFEGTIGFRCCASLPDPTAPG